MSRVFVADEKALGRKVVVKVLPPEMGAGVKVDRFRGEIQLAASLQHPHIVPLHWLQEGDRVNSVVALIRDDIPELAPLRNDPRYREESSRSRLH